MNTQKEAYKRAQELTANATELLKLEVFTGYFTSRVRERIDKLAKEILESESLTPEQREIKRHQRLELLDVLKIPEDDIAFSRETLKHGSVDDEEAIGTSDLWE